MKKYFAGAVYSGFKPNLQGKVAVLTGGNSGIGKEIAISLAEQKCKVIIGARDTERSEKMIERLRSNCDEIKIEQYYLDLSDTSSIKEFSEKITTEKIDFLINNAGVMSIPQRRLTKQGFEMQYGTNHLGHFYLTSLLFNKLNKSEFFRIINTSSRAHNKLNGFLTTPRPNFDDIHFSTTRYSPTLSYSRSKLCNNLFTHALAERISQEKGLAVSFHPGLVRTNILRNVIDSSWKKTIFGAISPMYNYVTKSSFEGAQTAFLLLYEPSSKLVNGGYYVDCCLATESIHVIKDNWDKLWEVSEKDLWIKFNFE